MSDWRDGTIVVVVVGIFLVPVFRLAKILVRNLCTACGFLQPRKKKKVAAAPPMLKGRAALGLERRGVGRVSEGGAGGGGGGEEDDYESDGGGVGGSGKKAKATGQVLLVAKKVRSTGQAPGSTQSDFMQQRAARLDRLAKDKGHNAAKAAWQVWSPPMLELDERGQMGKTRPQSKAQGRLKRGTFLLLKTHHFGEIACILG